MADEGVHVHSGGGLAALAVELAPEATLLLSEAGEVEMANARAHDLFGYPHDAFVGVRVASLFGGPHAALAMAELSPCGWRGETLAHQRDGNALPVEAIMRPLPAPEGRYVLVTVIDITERRRVQEHERQQAAQLAQLNEDLSRTNVELARLSSRLLTIQDQERERIAYDLHDDFGQFLAVIRMNLELIHDQIPPELVSTRTCAARTLNHLQRASDSLRTTVKRLRPLPLETLGLARSLEHQLVEFRQQASIDCELQVFPPDVTLDNARATMVVRIVQEALTNVLRHANASHVRVMLTCRGDSGTLRVRDDGSGMPSAEKVSSGTSLGLLSIRARARAFGGTLRIERPEGGGTELVIRFHLDDTPAG